MSGVGSTEPPRRRCRLAGAGAERTLLDVAAVRARFSALDRPLAFLDAPGGTQCPDEVIDAISAYLREDNANIGAPYETSIRTEELIERARAAAGRWLGCHPDEVAFGQSMTSLNFLLTRSFGRTLATGDEILVTKLDHDANVAPWLELEHDLGIVVRFVEVNDDLTLDLADLERQLSDRTQGRRVPDRVERGRHDARRRADRRAGAFGRCARLGRRGPLRAARPDRRRGVGRRRPPLLAVQVLRAASRARLRRRRAARLVAAVQGAPGVERAGREPLPARHPAARAARRLRRCRRVRGVAGLGGDRGPRDRARPPLPRRAAGAGRALRASHDVGSRADVLFQPPRASRGRRRHRAGGAGDRRLARRLLRGRGDEAARPRRGGRRPRGLRPLQHGRGGRPPPRGRSPELC